MFVLELCSPQSGIAGTFKQGQILHGDSERHDVLQTGPEQIVCRFLTKTNTACSGQSAHQTFVLKERLVEARIWDKLCCEHIWTVQRHQLPKSNLFALPNF